MIIGVIAAVLLGLEVLFSRYLIAGRHVKPTHYITLGFLFMFIFLLPGYYFFDISGFEPYHVYLFAALFLMAGVFNIFMSNGLKLIPVERAEPFMQSKFIITVTLAVVFFPDERNFVDVILALVAGITLLVLSVEKKHLKLGKGEIFMLLFALTVSIHDIIAKSLLDYYNPYTFLLIRAGFMALIFGILYHPVFTDVNERKGWLFAFFGLYLVGMNYFLFWSIAELGIVLTNLLLSASPLIAIWSAKLILKEDIHMKNVFATIIIVCCIVVSLVL